MTPARARAEGRETGRKGGSDRIREEHLLEMSDECIDEWQTGYYEGLSLRQAEPEERAA